MFWRKQTQRDIENLEAEVRDLQQKYYSTQADLSRLLEHLKLVRVKTPEQTAFVPVDSGYLAPSQGWFYNQQNAMNAMSGANYRPDLASALRRPPA